MVTIYEVALAAKVSPKTAARILAGSGGRSQNRKRVLDAAKRLGYVRNQQAANLRSGKSGLLGLLVPDIRNPYYPIFFQAIHDVALTHGYQILLSSTFGSNVEAVQALRMFEVNRVEGIFLNAAEGESDEECDAILNRFVARGVPIIVAGRPARSVVADEVVLLNKIGIQKSMAYLRKIGRRKIAFISGGQTAQATIERLEGYTAALQAHKITVDPALISYGAFTAESGQQQTQRLLEKTPDIDAIVAANDMIALGAIRACQSLGRSVPRDIAVVGFDDIPLAQLCVPALTTLRQPTEQTAKDCVNLLLSRIRGEDTSPPKRLIYEPELLIRESA